MGADLGLRMLSLLGLFVMIVVALLFSENRRIVSFRIIFWGLGLQLILAVLVLHTALGRWLFQGVNGVFNVISDASTEGASFVFGNLSRLFVLEQVMTPGADGQMVVEESFVVNALFAFNVLPVIIFVAGVAAILQHLGVIQAVVRAMAWLMRRSLKTSGAESFGAALLVFTGIESMSALGGYLQRMTRSELFTIMTAFLATIAASVMVAYANFGAEPGHLLTASLMSAPAAILLAKLLVPEQEIPETLSEDHISVEVDSRNIFDAATRGASIGLNMALHVAAMLIVFVGLIYLADRFSLWLTGYAANTVLGYCFRPFAVIMGVPFSEVGIVAELLATKSIFNEFIAYQNMQQLIADGLLSKRSVTITTYALCGFANPGSLGILIGGIAALAPERRAEIASMSWRAFLGGTLASFMTACVAGMLVFE
ncbi:MAG: nucleoside transporter C-terminal domain-containing protein [Candidatus Hydrogenedentales bacterium]|jgi:CNT family concentrative nucleoside transporter